MGQTGRELEVEVATVVDRLGGEGGAVSSPTSFFLALWEPLLSRAPVGRSPSSPRNEGREGAKGGRRGKWKREKRKSGLKKQQREGEGIEERARKMQLVRG